MYNSMFSNSHRPRRSSVKTLLNLVMYALLCAGVFLLGFFVVAPSLKKNSVRQDLKVEVPETNALPRQSTPNTDGKPVVEVIPRKAESQPPTDNLQDPDQEESMQLEIHQAVSEEDQQNNEETNQQPPSEPAVEVPKKEDPVQVQTSSGLYRVEVAGFSDESSASQASDSLAAKGYEPVTNKVITESGTQYRLQVGAFRNKDNADRIADDVRKAGYPAQVVGGDR